MNATLTARLSLMMFLQFFVWGAWATTLNQYMPTIGMAESIPWAYSVGPIAAIVAPFFLGMVADRFFAAEKVLGILGVLGGAALLLMPSAAGSPLFLGLLLAHMLCYMPTLGLTSTLAFYHMTNQEKEFPFVRVFGTVGWVAAGVVVSKWLGADLTPLPLYIAGGTFVAFGLYSFTLPHTPPKGRQAKTTVREILGLDALKQLSSRSFVVFLVSSALIFIAFGAYFSYASLFVNNVGIPDPAFQMTFGQMSEIVFMLLIPFFFARLGVKWMLAAGMIAWVVRFGLFAGAAIDGVYWMILLGILVHGICYDFFFVTGQIYIDKKTTPDIRGQAQGLLVLLTQGVGMLIGAQLSGVFFNNMAAGAGALAPAQWQVFWGVFAGAATVFALAFIFLFRETPTQSRPATERDLALEGGA